MKVTTWTCDLCDKTATTKDSDHGADSLPNMAWSALQDIIMCDNCTTQITSRRFLAGKARPIKDEPWPPQEVM